MVITSMSKLYYLGPSPLKNDVDAFCFMVSHRNEAEAMKRAALLADENEESSGGDGNNTPLRSIPPVPAVANGSGR